MSVTALVLLVSTALYAGFQWTIRVLVYPQFAEVGRGEFVRYEAAHQRRVSLAVGPLFAALVLSTAAVAVRPPKGSPWWLIGAAVVLAGLLLGVTALMAVPLHRRLSRGFDRPTHHRLVRVDSLRLVLALVDVIVAITLLVR